MKMYFVNGCCGSNKTGAMIEFIGRNKDKFVVASMSIALANATAARFKAAFPDIASMTIHSDNFDNVRVEIEKALLDQSVHVIFVTHEAVLRYSALAGAGMAQLIIDEVPNVSSEFDRNLSLTYHSSFRKYFDAEEMSGYDGVKLVLKPEFYDEVKARAMNAHGDDEVKVTQDLWRKAVNKHWTLVMSQAAWNTDADQLGGKKKLIVSSELHPGVVAQWSSVTIMGANFSTSRMAMIWPSYSVEFEPHPAIGVTKPDHDTTVGNRLTIRYITRRDFSKKLRDKVGMDVIVSAIADHLPDTYIWTVNNDIDTDDIKAIKAGTRVPPISHGLNEYRAHTTVVCLLALNDRNFHAKYLRTRYLLTDEQLHMSRTGETVYQLLMRSNLREADGISDVVAWVADRRTAEYLADLIPGAKLEYVDLGLPALHLSKVDDKKPAASARERMKKQRETRQEARERVKAIIALHRAATVEIGDAPIWVTVEHSTSATRDEIDRVPFYDWGAFRDFLRDDCYPRKLTDKQANYLMCGSCFDFDATPDSYKGKANVVFSNVLQIDFDDADLAPAIASKVLRDLKHIVYNSYNTMKNGKPRYRIVLPLEAAVDPLTYEQIWEAVTQRFVDLGYNVGKRIVGGADSGVDRGKNHAASFMYLPSQAANARDSFWIDNWDAEALDPAEWVNRLVPAADEMVSVAQLERIESDKRTALVLAGSGVKLETIRAQAAEAAKNDAVNRFHSKLAQVPSGATHQAILSLINILFDAGHSGWEIEGIMVPALAMRPGGSDHIADVKRNCRNIDTGRFNRTRKF